MARTSKSDVKETFDAAFESETGDPDDISDDAVDQWIDIANHLVDDVAAADSSLSSSRLTDLETLVAQHFLATQAPRAESQSGGVRSISYQGETGMGFKATQYGQRALTLDPTGTLAGSNRPGASLSVPDLKET
jgi:hypothetical protein